MRFRDQEKIAGPVRATPVCSRGRAFTLVELLVVLLVLGVLASLTFVGAGQMRESAHKAHCTHSLRQLGSATQMYLQDNNQKFFAYSASHPDGRLWYFGLEPTSSLGKPEGERELDMTRAPLYAYAPQVGGIGVCPSFPYDSGLWKPKFKGASYGYGYNTMLSNRNAFTIERPARVILFGDCAQVNTFQPPASSKRPMLEEFYMLDSQNRTVHFRHRGRAQFVFLDGHVDALPMLSGTGDTRMPGAHIGRITPVGSNDYLW